MVTCELSRVGCCLRRRQQQISTCRSQEGGKSLSRAENDPMRLSQKVEKNRHSETRYPPPPRVLPRPPTREDAPPRPSPRGAVAK